MLRWLKNARHTPLLPQKADFCECSCDFGLTIVGFYAKNVSGVKEFHKFVARSISKEQILIEQGKHT